MSDIDISGELSAQRNRLSKIYHYLEALNQVRNPVKKLIGEQPWILWIGDLPDHPSIEIASYSDVQENGEESEARRASYSETTKSDFIIKIRRPKLTSSPIPPDVLKRWLLRGWEEYGNDVNYHESLNKIDEQGDTIVERFDEDEGRAQLLNEWLLKRQEWQENEKPAREAMKVFERFYDLYMQVEREAERLEIVLGEGLLSWRHKDGDVYHPILLQRLQIRLDSEIPEISLYETDHPVELYSALFRTMNDVDGRELGKIREELTKGFYHPLGGEETTSFFRRISTILSPYGEVVGDIELQGASENPIIARRPVVFLRSRTLGYASALETIISDIEERETFPASLLDIVGLHGCNLMDDFEVEKEAFKTANEDSDILFSKPANDEQLQVARRLLRHNSVLVQGPPGTGKSHTIANLIGHLLAQGKSILVTSYSTKALRVLRSHVVEDIRPLCVSVLDRDADSRDQLEGSIISIVEKLSGGHEALEREASLLAERRGECLDRILTVRKQMLFAWQNEYRDLSVDGKQVSPSEAARVVFSGKGKDDWIPGTIAKGEPLPLSEEDIETLYRTNSLLSADDENELQHELPPLDMLLNPEDFREHSMALDKAAPGTGLKHCDYWSCSPREQKREQLEDLRGKIVNETGILRSESDWVTKIIDAGRRGGIDRQSWESLISIMREIDNKSGYIREVNLRYKPVLSTASSIESQLKTLNEIVDYLQKSNQIKKLTLLSHKEWRQTISVVRVSGRQPQTLEEFTALRDLALSTVNRRSLIERWNYQVANIGGPRIDELGENYEEACLQLCESIQEAIDWYENKWLSLREEIINCGLLFKNLEDEVKASGQYGEINLIREILLKKIPCIFENRIEEISACIIEDLLIDLEKQLWDYGDKSTSAKSIEDICHAIRERNADEYVAHYNTISQLHDKRDLFSKRRELLTRIERVAPLWAERIRNHLEPHDTDELPGDVKLAWAWLQMKQELDERSNTSIEALQETSHKLSGELQSITAELVSKSAWAAQVKRTTHSQRQSLVGWLQTVKKIGKGTGKRVPRLRAEARMRMNESQSAVPVWIMPLSRVVENFEPGKISFDVVIIDEASQCDVMALIALYMGKQVIIVGDDKQVSPEAVGQRVEEVQHLIDEHLSGIPNSNLYDGQMSIYDLALQSFGGSICLLEHFRCVPDIINFSNVLCYNGKIKPLRDSSKTDLKPYVVPFYIDCAISKNKVNEKEATAISSLLLAAIEHEEYEGKTFGVISLVGEEQAQEIERILRRTLSPIDFEKRKILCGNPAHFQGDERDVVFISMVDGPEGGPLRLRNDERFKKRFNVAASRAKDQMWIVYSLDIQKDLKPGDLRKQLIEYVINPNAYAEALEEGQRLTESEFEKQVFAALTSRGYKVTPQYKVGYYRIDMVVEEDGRRLAVECDGDRFHPLEKLEEDMARQAVLERLGWTFLRIRGSEYFRNPEETMESVVRKLDSYEIFPGIEAESSSKQEKEISALVESLIRDASALKGEWAEGKYPEYTANKENSIEKKSQTVTQNREGVSPIESAVKAEAAKKETTYATAPSDYREPEDRYNRYPLDIGKEKPLIVEEEKGDTPIAEHTVESSDQLRLFEKAKQTDPQKKNAIEEHKQLNDPLYNAISENLEHKYWNCASCGKENNLYIGRYGPFLQCSNKKCDAKLSVPLETTEMAVKQLKLECNECGSSCIVARGRNGPFVGCSKFPECKHAVPWKELRKELKESPN